VAVIARKASDKEVDVKANDNKFLKRKLKEPTSRKDPTGKTHRNHVLAFTACKSMSAILTRLMDYHAAMADPNDAKDGYKEVHLSELLTHANLTDKLDDMSERELLEYALNTVHEQSVVVYLTYHYNHEVVYCVHGGLAFPRGSVHSHAGENRRGGEEGPKMTSSTKLRSLRPALNEKEEREVEKEVAKGRSGLESSSSNKNNNKIWLAFRRDSEEFSLPELKREAP
jgi:hypothetical protein